MQNRASVDTSVRHLTVTADQAGQRIDNFLMALARSVPKSHIYRIIRKGQVRVGGGRIKPTYRLQEHDTVRVPPLLVARREPSQVPDALIEALENAVLHEDDEIIALNKPPGVAVHAGSGVHFGVIDAFRQSRASLETRLELVHRLDRGTSGCLLLAKNRQATRKYQQLFRQRQVEKQYTALLMGHWPHTLIRVDLPLRKHATEGARRLVSVDPQGKEALSHFRLIETLGSGDLRASLLEIRIETGRTHQIRVHSAAQGHPVVGDERYAEDASLQHFRRAGLKRLFLHCSRLQFSVGGRLSVQAEPDAGWQASLRLLTNAGQ